MKAALCAKAYLWSQEHATDYMLETSQEVNFIISEKLCYILKLIRTEKQYLFLVQQFISYILAVKTTITLLKITLYGLSKAILLKYQVMTSFMTPKIRLLY
jgi:hypothetical protein